MRPGDICVEKNGDLEVGRYDYVEMKRQGEERYQANLRSYNQQDEPNWPSLMLGTAMTIGFSYVGLLAIKTHS
jgi:hypothetical protein